MTKAARKLSQGQRACFRAALLVLFVFEVVAFRKLGGAAHLAALPLITGAAALILLPFVIGAFRRFRLGVAFYVVFVFAFICLSSRPLLAFLQGENLFEAAVERVRPGMTRQECEQVLQGYKKEDLSSWCGFFSNENHSSKPCVYSAYSSSLFFHDTYGSDYAEVIYEQGRVLGATFHEK